MAIHGTIWADWIDAADGVTNGSDTIYGYDSEDFIFGLAGDDWIVGGAGADYINGGTDIDTASYSDSAAGVTVNLSSGEGSGGTAEGDVLVNVENLYGSAHADTLIGNFGSNVLDGNGGADTLKGGGGADTLSGGGGNDWLKGGGGADRLTGGTGIDTADYQDSSAGVTVFLNASGGYANGGDATGDTLYSIENLNGSAHADFLYGDDNANVISGRSGDDGLKGYGGADTLYGGQHNDLLYGMDGTDTLYGENGTDTLYGGAGFDLLNGGADNDILIGGTDKDTMFGGAGADTFKIESLADAPAAGYLFTDYIPDFQPGIDKIDLSAIDANVFVAGNQAFTPIGTEVAFNGVAGELRLTGGFLEGDVNGDAVADFQIEFDVILLAGDFIL